MGWPSSFLNEVLSLNAQEYIPPTVQTNTDTVLNEVLSLNAQEFTRNIASLPFKVPQ